MKTCSEPECDRKVLARGICSRHYDKLRRAGGLEPLPGQESWHRISDVNAVARTGTCSVCGPVRVRIRKTRSGAECWTLIRKGRQKRRASSPETRSPSARGKHGLSAEGYAAMLDAQAGVCAICHEPAAEGDRLRVDHDHRCHPGTDGCPRCIRGLLCHRCNIMLGWARDDVKRLASAVAYLAA